ncbi:hypothetical protein [Nonomuraea rhizosphaerae]|uniref:hypothetical protein n=1 Tax=Nonomuraea rhizosphaerae TaxID=2665663 RepID=UPI001C5DF264|nr:hypothetical protein [Nonomuraea rhizosphaerae]
MADHVFGDKISGGVQYKQQSGRDSNMTINNGAELTRADLDAAVSELHAFVAQLTRDGAVSADGAVTDPGAVVAAVQSQPGRLKALGRAVAGGAKDAVLSVVQNGVAALIVALVGRG